MFKVYKYSLPFSEPFKTGAGTIQKREGLIARFTDNESDFLSEIAPLPGFSKESIHEVWDVLSSQKKQIDSFLTGPYSIEQLSTFLGTLPDIPSLQFGVSSMGLFVLAERSGTTLPGLLNRPLQQSLKINAVLGSGKPDELKRKAVKMHQSGFRVLKCKVNGDPGHLPRTLADLSSEFPDLIFRLDANQTWNFATVEKFSEQFRKLPVEYVEEPLKLSSPAEYQDLINKCKLPVAADETVNHFGFSELVSQPFTPPYFILKPMILGNLVKLIETFSHHNHLEKRAIFTTAFESAVGRRIISLIAGMYGSRESAHGLNTGIYLPDGLATEKNIQNGKYRFEQNESKLYNFKTINSSKLERVL